ncbi:MAG TPA: hypothetical protein P5543_02790 [Planctomycetota bacterium]|nr:hypothetical protein [Planctomycetota bacterium]HRU51101.1 hypothetical protein [Planctomycetota bacterium]
MLLVINKSNVLLHPLLWGNALGELALGRSCSGELICSGKVLRGEVAQGK